MPKRSVNFSKYLMKQTNRTNRGEGGKRKRENVDEKESCPQKRVGVGAGFSFAFPLPLSQQPGPAG